MEANARIDSPIIDHAPWALLHAVSLDTAPLHGTDRLLLTLGSLSVAQVACRAWGC